MMNASNTLLRSPIARRRNIGSLHERPSKLVINYESKIQFINYEDIIYLMENEQETLIYLNDGQKVRTTTKIHEFPSLMHNFSFFQIHQKYMVNLNYLEFVSSKENRHSARLAGFNLPISNTKFYELKTRINF